MRHAVFRDVSSIMYGYELRARWKCSRLSVRYIVFGLDYTNLVGYSYFSCVRDLLRLSKQKQVNWNAKTCWHGRRHLGSGAICWEPRLSVICKMKGTRQTKPVVGFTKNEIQAYVHGEYTVTWAKLFCGPPFLRVEETPYPLPRRILYGIFDWHYETKCKYAIFANRAEKSL